MRFLPPKKTHLAILVVGVAFFAQAVAAPAPPNPENKFLMRGGVGGQDQTTTTQNDPEHKFTMSSGVGGQHESESTQEPSDVISPMNDPDYGSFSGAAQGINEPDGLLDRNTPMIHATLYISSHLESMYPNFPNLSGYKRPVQKMLNTVKMDTLLRALKSKSKSKDSSLSKLRSKDVGKRVVITKVITDEEIQSPSAFILRFFLSVPKTKGSEPSSDSETGLRYTGDIDWDDGCIDKMEDGGYWVHSECTGELRDDQHKQLWSYKREHVWTVKARFLFHPSLAKQTHSDEHFEPALAYAVQTLLAPMANSREGLDQIKNVVSLPNDQRKNFEWRVVEGGTEHSLKTDQDFQITMIKVFDQKTLKWSAASEDVEPMVYAGRINWEKSLQKNGQGVYELQKGKLTGELRDVRDKKVLVLFEKGKQKIPAPESTGFFKKALQSVV
ncbi:hypothetical protein EV361DRAFT_440552 [Lentinula raphanica]|nr:hypothetical protein EV361DRAFT_440552 [Lentinula raphanica]